jgi:hypothetical protein
MTAPAVHVCVIPAPPFETSPTTVSIGGSSQRPVATGHVTSRRLRIGPSGAQPNPTSLQSASALSLRHFGPVSIEVFIAVLVILDPDAAESHPGSTTPSRRRSYAQSPAKLPSQLA